MSGELLLRHTTLDNGRTVITAYVGDGAVFTDQIDVADAATREAFVQKQCRRCPGPYRSRRPGSYGKGVVDAS